MRKRDTEKHEPVATIKKPVQSSKEEKEVRRSKAVC